MSSKSLCTDSLISHRFSINEAAQAYDILSSSEPSLGILLQYQSLASPEDRFVDLTINPKPDYPLKPILNVIGSGNYSSRVLIPAFAKAGSSFNLLGSSSGTSSLHVGRKYSFNSVTTDIPALLSDPSSNCVVIATRHDSHGSYVRGALEAGKHVL